MLADFYSRPLIDLCILNVYTSWTVGSTPDPTITTRESDRKKGARVGTACFWMAKGIFHIACSCILWSSDDPYLTIQTGQPSDVVFLLHTLIKTIHLLYLHGYLCSRVADIVRRRRDCPLAGFKQNPWPMSTQVAIRMRICSCRPPRSIFYTPLDCGDCPAW